MECTLAQPRAFPGARSDPRKKYLRMGVVPLPSHGTADGDRDHTGYRRHDEGLVYTGEFRIRNLKAQLLVSALLPQRQPTVVRSDRRKWIDYSIRFDWIYCKIILCLYFDIRLVM